MSRKKRSFLILFLLFSTPVLWVSPASSVTVDEITRGLACTCGCNMLVSACEGAMECGAADRIKAQVMERLKLGQSKEEIIGYFVSRYGEKVLSAPTKKGFNLTAWVLPFLVVVSGGGILYLTLKRWHSTGRERKEDRKAVGRGKVEGKYLERFEQELKEFDY
jgi:cytochrome c-type biogenesis protein CcmH